MLEYARADGETLPVHAYPRVDNPPSNAVCRKAGFTLLGEEDFEISPGRRAAHRTTGSSPWSPSSTARGVASRGARLLAVAVGGLIGTGLRLACDLAFPHADGELPVETLVVNFVGTFALGLARRRPVDAPHDPAWLKAGLGSGVIGSFTTLSAVMAALLVLTRAGEAWLAVLYLLLSVAAGSPSRWRACASARCLAHRADAAEVTDAGETL